MIGDKVDFFFVGFPKSGSTTFWHLCKSHPEIFSSEIKEIHFFNTDHINMSKTHLRGDFFQLISSEADYTKLFQNSSNRIKGDFTPINIFSEEASHNIFRYNPAAKILISIREPVSFLRSLHFQYLYDMSEDEPDFIKAISLEDSRRTGQKIPKLCANPFYLHYSSLVEYKKYIERYVNLFGTENVKIVLFDDMAENERQIYRDTLRFLKIQNIDFEPLSISRNPNHSLRFIWLRKLMFHPPVKKWLYTNVPKNLLPVGARFSEKLFKKTQAKPYVPEQDITQLKLRFHSQVVQLNSFLVDKKLLFKDLVKLWGY
jgi:hypothetical protein